MDNKNNVQPNNEYVLIGREKFYDGIICFLIFKDDKIVGIVTTGILLSAKTTPYNALVVGHTYKFIEEDEIMVITDIDDICLNVLNIPTDKL